MDMLSGIVATSIRLEEQAKILTGPTSDRPTYLPPSLYLYCVTSLTTAAIWFQTPC